MNDESILKIEDLRYAFYVVCYRKFLEDGYFDFEPYASKPFSLTELLKMLPQDSLYRELFQSTKPTGTAAYDFWHSKLAEGTYKNGLTYLEAEALIYRAYLLLGKQDGRQLALRICFGDFQGDPKAALPLENVLAVVAVDEEKSSRIKETYLIYDANRVTVKILHSVCDLKDEFHIASNDQIFFRGHSSVNYRLLPAVFRKKKSQKFFVPNKSDIEDFDRELLFYESDIFNEVQIRCPEEFSSCKTVFEKLVKMQHYGLPTRLLDITENPLVALYFACVDNQNYYGELLAFDLRHEDIFYSDTDEVLIPSALAALSADEKENLCRLVDNFYAGWNAKSGINPKKFRGQMETRLYDLLLQRFHSLIPSLAPYDINNFFRRVTSNVAVKALRANQRIKNQSGAFIAAGLQSTNPSSLPIRRCGFRDQEDGNHRGSIYIVGDKENIIHELADVKIDSTFVFPEIESVSSYLKAFYENDPYGRKPGQITNLNPAFGRKYPQVKDFEEKG